MMLRRLIRVNALSLLAVACGGKVAGPEDSTEDPTQEVGGLPADETEGSRESSDESVSLPPCTLGFLRTDEPGRLCMWITDDGRCYATKLDACACACRETSGDSCLSPYLDAPESQIPVDCF